MVLLTSIKPLRIHAIFIFTNWEKGWG